jgi:D-glycero-D-manno-heptose 1,7-bisphosphate phosphatase
MNKAIFFDRDGVINNDKGLYYIYNPDDFELNEGVFETFSRLNNNGYLIVIISNQGGIAKGIYTKSHVDIIHNLLIENAAKENIIISEIYYCPHHNDYGRCLCRKPDSLLIEKALARFDIDPLKSYFIGDSERDIKAANKSGIDGLLIKSNQNVFNQIRDSKLRFLLDE